MLDQLLNRQQSYTRLTVTDILRIHRVLGIFHQKYWTTNVLLFYYFLEKGPLFVNAAPRSSALFLAEGICFILYFQTLKVIDVYFYPVIYGRLKYSAKQKET